MKDEENLPFMSRIRGGRYLSLGLDHGTCATRYVLVDADKRRILSWGTFELEQHQHEKDKRYGSSFLRDLAKRVSLNRLKCIHVNAQGSSVIMGRFQIPVAEKTEQQHLIRAALKSQLSFPVENAVYFCREYAKIAVAKERQTKGKATEKAAYNFVAMDRNALSSLIDPITEIFHIVPNVTIQGYAYESLVESFDLSAPKETIALLNIGRGVTSISIFQDRKMVFERHIPLAGQDITRSILIMYRPEDAPEKMLDLSGAEQMKKASAIPLPYAGAQEGGEEPGIVEGDSVAAGEKRLSESQNQRLFQAVQGVLAAWVQDVKLSFRYYYDNYNANKITKVYVFGGSANLTNLIPYLNRQFGIETRLLAYAEESSVSIVQTQDAAHFKDRFHEYAPALAFALKPDRYASLTPRNLQKVNYADIFAPIFRLAFVAAAAVLVTWFAFLAIQSFYLNSIHTALRTHRQFLTGVEAPYLELTRWHKFLNQADTLTPKASMILREMTRRMPPNFLLSKIYLDRQQGDISAEGVVFGDPKKQAVDIAEFTKLLKQSKLFTRIEVPKLDPVTHKARPQGAFKVTAKLVKGSAELS